MVDNAEWLDRLEYIPFLRDVGRHFSINRMLTMDSVRLRLEREQPLSFLEFNYMILQAYDFVELHRRYGCRLQCGGSDQWGNIVSGIDLGRRIDSVELFGLTSPLITTVERRQDGKDGGGRRVAQCRDVSALRLLAISGATPKTPMSDGFCAFSPNCRGRDRRGSKSLQGSELNEAKKILATEATALCHGREAAEGAAETARRTFETGEIAEGLPTFEIPREGLREGIFVANLAQSCGLTASTGEARRLIQSGGMRLNDQVVSDVKATVSLADVTADGVIKLSIGRKKHALARPV